MKELWLRRVQSAVAVVVLVVVCTLTFMSWSSTRSVHYILTGNWTTESGLNALQLVCRREASQCVCDITPPHSQGTTYTASAQTFSLYDNSLLVHLVAEGKDTITAILTESGVLHVRAQRGGSASGKWLPMTTLHRAASGGTQDVWTTLKAKGVYLAGLFAVMMAYKSLQTTLFAPSRPIRRPLPRALPRKKLDDEMQKAEKREMCYATRDAFHRCLDTMPEDSETTCAADKRRYDEACPKSWVSYFEKQRERELILQLQVEQYKGRNN